VDIDTLWRNRQTGNDFHWKGGFVRFTRNFAMEMGSSIGGPVRSITRLDRQHQDFLEESSTQAEVPTPVHMSAFVVAKIHESVCSLGRLGSISETLLPVSDLHFQSAIGVEPTQALSKIWAHFSSYGRSGLRSPSRASASMDWS
jgi:hypothetical protein